MRQNSFDFLRFFFAFVVVLAHIVVLSGVESFQKYSSFFNSYLSVTAFFCISGFLITQSYLRTDFLINYFKKRAARLLPAYLLVLICSVTLLSFTSEYNLKEFYTHPQLYTYLLANLSFLNFVQPALPGVFLNPDMESAVNGALWTLKVEVSFYIAIPFIIYIINKSSRKFIPIFLLYSISIVYRTGLEHYAASSGSEFYNIIARQFPGFISYFASGIAFYYYSDFLLSKKKCFFLIGVLIYLFEREFGLEILTPFALSLMIFTFAYSFKYFNNFGKHGDMSYGIYIYHFPIIQTARYYNLFNRFNPYVVSIILIAIVLIISFISWHKVEKPFLDRIKSKG